MNTRVIKIATIPEKLRYKAKDKTMEYERNNWLIETIRIPLVLFLNFLPARLSRFFLLKFSSRRGGSADVVRWSTQFQAIETIYTYPERLIKGETSIFEYFWYYLLNNPRGLRNRLILTTHQLIDKIEMVAQKKKRCVY